MLQIIINIQCESGSSLKDPKIDTGIGKMNSKPTEAEVPLSIASSFAYGDKKKNRERVRERGRDSHTVTVTAQHIFPVPIPAAGCLFSNRK